MDSKKAFTLIELAVVVLILGLITAGIISGRELLRQSELRSIMTDLENHKSAYKLFVQTYGKAPGDFEKGSLYWPNGSLGCANGGGTCNGNGDGIISYSLVGGPSGNGGISENIIALRQMKMAQMLDFPSAPITSGIYNSSATVDKMLPGTNAPSSRRAGAGYFYTGYEVVNNQYVLQNCGDTTSPWAGEGVNSVYIGRASVYSGFTDGDIRGGLSFGAVTAAEAFQIDMKMDDANVVSGSFTGRNTGKIRIFDGCTPAIGSCFSLGAYNITYPTMNCLLGYQVDD